MTHDPVWPEHYSGSRAEQGFDARVSAGRLDLLQERVIVFDPRSRALYSDQARENVRRAVDAAKRRAAAGSGATTPPAPAPGSASR